MFLCRKLFCDIKTRAERSEAIGHTSSVPRKLFIFISKANIYNKINSVLGSGELSENTTLEKLLFNKFSLYKPNLMF